jgi:hypothetical protein
MRKTGINRREFLRTGGFALASVAAAGSVAGVVLNPASAWARATKTLDEHAVKTLIAMSRALYPHASITDEQYGKTVEGFAQKAKKDNAFATLLREGVTALDAAAQGKWLDASDEVKLQALKSLETTPFFRTVRGTLIGAGGPYNLPVVWKQFGYEGSSWQLGGYLTRGFNDIAWLPKE